MCELNELWRSKNRKKEYELLPNQKIKIQFCENPTNLLAKRKLYVSLFEAVISAKSAELCRYL